MMSIGSSSSIKSNAFRGISNGQPRLSQARSEGADKFVIRLSTLSVMIFQLRERDGMTTVVGEEGGHTNGLQMLGTIQSECHHRLRPISDLLSMTNQ
eukprot:6192726-Pleurochrysis_carterae.AAC.1